MANPEHGERYCITSAQAGVRPNERLLQSMETYTAENAGRLVVLPMIGRDASEDWRSLHPDFADMDVEYGTRMLNDRIQIGQFHVKPQAIDPTTGLQRFAQRGRTQIIASPKQFQRPVPHSMKQHPKFLVTTGALTNPNYANGDDNSAERRRLGSIALRDHTFGGLLVEVADSDTFYMRHITSNGRGSFVDLGKKYDGKEITEAKCEAMVLGDYHCGRTDPGVLEATYRMIEEMKPKRVVLHDFFDGHSVSHWAEKEFITQGIHQQLDLGHTSLEQELRQCYEELCVLAEKADEIVVVMSNHHEFLWRWLNEGRFVKDKENARFGYKLASYMAEKDENDPVEHGIRMIGKLPKNIRFLKRTDDYKVRGYQLGAHGDKGTGFGYGSVKSKEEDYGQSISGHVHKSQTMRRTHTVGTMLPLEMFYMRGSPSAWTNSHAVIYDNGAVQHLILDQGEYHL